MYKLTQHILSAFEEKIDVQFNFKNYSSIKSIIFLVLF